MLEIRKLVKVFLASPGDLSEERKSAKSVVDEFNISWAEEFSYHVELVGWEDTVSVHGRPQATINRELDRCDLFVGMLWKRWGTPPDNIGNYTSGFEEEFALSMERRSRIGQPEMSLYFKDIDPELIRDPGPELKKVLSFKDQLIADKNILFESFSDARDFEKKLRRCITNYIRGLRSKESEKQSEPDQALNSNPDEQNRTNNCNDASNTPLSVEGANFLRAFISKTETVEYDQITPSEIARFRLLASLLKRSENDERFLGAHDANLLFIERSLGDFGREEITGLINCGLENFQYSNVPFWHWYATYGGFKTQLLPFYSLFGSFVLRSNAIAAMKLITEPLPSKGGYNREYFLRSWFSENAESTLRASALGYLSKCGVTSDLAIIREEFGKNDSLTNYSAIEAIIHICLRDSREKALLELYELQPIFIHPKTMAALFQDESLISTETLLKGIEHINSGVRLSVVKLLIKRQGLTVEIADKLLGDPDPRVRHEALLELIKHGRIFSDNEAEQILVKKTPSIAGNPRMGLPSALGNSSGEDYWKQYQRERLKLFAEESLINLVEQMNMDFNQEARFVLCDLYFKRHGDKLRNLLSDQYKSEFTRIVYAFVEKHGEDFREDIEQLRDFTCKQLTRKGLDLICRKAEAKDINLVRATLKSGMHWCSDADIDYIGRFGEWEDIKLLIDIVEQPIWSGTLGKPISVEEKYCSAALAICQLVRKRVPEVLAMEMPSRLLSQVIIVTPDKIFRDLGDHAIIDVFRLQDETVRKMAALKCVKALPKKSLVKLLDMYISGDHFRYYNVIHWLDFGISTPRERAILAANEIINGR
ncbi:MAG: DUF4062 domain-containing protein [Methylococcaceae bacterium]